MDLNSIIRGKKKKKKVGVKTPPPDVTATHWSFTKRKEVQTLTTKTNFSVASESGGEPRQPLGFHTGFFIDRLKSAYHQEHEQHRTQSGSSPRQLVSVPVRFMTQLDA